MATSVSDAAECMILRGELADQPTLNYLRDSVGLMTFLIDHGGIAIYDPLSFDWWSPRRWKKRIFDPGGPVPRRHVKILTSEEESSAHFEALTWFHTRGMRKFGRPDLSLHGAKQSEQDAVIDLFERFIELQSLRSIIKEGMEIKMRTLPAGMRCHHAENPKDPDFNNVHVEIVR